MTTITVSTDPKASSPAPAGVLRRELHFDTLADILAAAESIAAGPVTTLGRWTAAQNLDHVRRLVRVAHAGTDVRMNWMFRVLGRLLKPRFLRSRFRAGLKTVDAFLPPAEITMEEAIVAFREEIALASKPGAMSCRSPLLGRLSHEEWEQLHCRHAELHFGFVVPASDA